MRRILSTTVLVLASMCIIAQDADPVLMHINGKAVKRSEFEYAFNKNNSALGSNSKAVEDYVPMFIDFKLKVAEAEALKLDTLASFKKELADNRAQLAEGYLVDNDYIEREAYSIYAKDSATIGADGFLSVKHLVFPLRQDANATQISEALAKADSAYVMLCEGKDFAEVGKFFHVSPSAYRPFDIIRGQVYREFEDVVYSLPDGGFSRPFRSPIGYHIAMRVSSRPFGSYSTYRENIIKMLEQRGIRRTARLIKGQELAREFGGNITAEQALAREDSLLEQKHPEFANLMQEYYDGLLFFEVCNRMVWNKAAADEKGLEKFFKKNKKAYEFETERFRGAVIHAKTAEDLAKAKELLSAVSYEEYKNVLEQNFFVDSLYTVRLEVGVFEVGSNGWVDKFVYKQGEGGKSKRGFDYVDVVGVLLDKPETYKDVKGNVVNDYQNYLEKQWVKKLRKKFDYKVDKEVLKTVNNHD